MLVLLSLLSCHHQGPADFAHLRPARELEGFAVEAVYTDHLGVERGARFVHPHTGFVLDLLRQETVPQAYVYVNTVPVDDRGAPHTQEHLLLGKGNRGRAVASAETFQLVDSSAFTETHRTVYHFRTALGPDGFYEALQERLHALLEPDYTDEEIRREVYHFGVDADPETGLLSLTEKGTVYNEMDTTSRSEGYALWGRILDDLYGPDHPESLDAGGVPDAMRSLGPADIRAFHAQTHALGNMGAVVFLPPEVTLPVALERMDAVLLALQPEPTEPGRVWPTEATLPAWETTADRTVREIRYPARDGTGLVSTTMVWAPRGDRPNREDLLMSLFFDAFAGDTSSNLYKALIDDETEERDTGAASVWAYQHEGGLGSPLILGAGDFPAAVDDATLAWVRDRMLQELRTVAGLAADAPALADFDRRVDAELVSWLRSTRMTMSQPPGFGTRGTGSGWFDFLQGLDREGGFERSLALADDFAWVRDELARDENVWTGAIARWGLLDDAPIVYVSRPDPAVLDELNAATAARLEAELERLQGVTGLADPQEAIRSYQAELDAATAILEAGRAPVVGRLADDPPLELDAGLSFDTRPIGGVPSTRVRFDTMTGARVVLALDLHRVPEAHDDLLWMFSTLLGDVGLVVDGVRLDNDAVEERLKREVRFAWATDASLARSDRAELLIGGEGTDLQESRDALIWMGRLLHDADWSEANLPRMRFLVKQALDRRLDDAPTDFAWTLRYQHAPLHLHLSAGAVIQRDLLRLKWRLHDAGADTAVVIAHIEALGRGETVVSEHPLAIEATDDLRRIARDLPETTGAADLQEVAAELAAALAEPPTNVLDELRIVRAALSHRDAARLVLVGGEVLDVLEPDVIALLDTLDPAPSAPVARTRSGTARARIAARGAPGATGHLFWLDPERRTGSVFIEAPFTRFDSLHDDAILDYLAANTLAGGGAHSLFMRTWGEGLAYSNGASASPWAATQTYTANRCPDIAQTVAFAASIVDDTVVDEAIAAYALALPFDSRAHDAPQTRGMALANDLVDGRGPAEVRAFRERILALRDRPGLADELERRQASVYGRILPGIGTLADGVITQATGDAAQQASWEAWLRASGLPPPVRVYPRDFWGP